MTFFSKEFKDYLRRVPLRTAVLECTGMIIISYVVIDVLKAISHDSRKDPPGSH